MLKFDRFRQVSHGFRPDHQDAFPINEFRVFFQNSKTDFTLFMFFNHKGHPGGQTEAMSNLGRNHDAALVVDRNLDYVAHVVCLTVKSPLDTALSSDVTKPLDSGVASDPKPVRADSPGPCKIARQ
jgi:hypothetical protein